MNKDQEAMVAFAYKVQKAVSNFASVRIVCADVFLQVLEESRSKLEDLFDVSKDRTDAFIREHLGPSPRLLYVSLQKSKQSLLLETVISSTQSPLEHNHHFNTTIFSTLSSLEQMWTKYSKTSQLKVV